MKKKRKNNSSNYLTSILSLVLLIAAISVGALDYCIPDQRAVYDAAEVTSYSESINGTIIKTEATAKVFGVPLKTVDVDVVPQLRLIPGGDVFGVKFFTKGVMIVGMADIESEEGILNPASKAGLRVGDNIITLNDKEVNTIEEVAEIFEKSDGKQISILYERDGIKGNTYLSPIIALSDGKYKSGLWIRDSTAGIGTVTYYNPETGDFAGLGHGICDIDTGKLMPMMRGNIVDINVNDIIRGTEGIPGEIKGEFGIIKVGELRRNTEKGVFGVMSNKPQCALDEPIEIALGKDVTEGEAYIYASLGGEKINKYRIELTRIYHNDSETKNFIFTVKDEELLKKTGGIVQGMSGSPIIQKGRLIGAVTHVLVNDPAKGYGIFIENMLAEAEKIK